MLTNKDNKDYRINSWSVRSLIILSTFAILLLYLSNTFLFDDVKQVWADSVIATIPVGNVPFGIAYDSGNGNMYVANQFSNTVSVIDTSNHQVIATIPVGNDPTTGPIEIAYDSGNGNMYVTNGSSSVSLINTLSNTVTATIPAGANPEGIAYDSGNGELYVTNIISNTVSVIDTSTSTVVGTIPVGDLPYYVAYNSDKGEMYVANYNSNTVSVINTSTHQVIATIPVGNEPLGIAYDSGNGKMYVTNIGSNTVSVIDTSSHTVVGTIPVGTYPRGIAYDSGNGKLYVANYGSNTVSVIDTSTITVVGTIPVGQGPFFVAYDSDNGEIYVTNRDSNTVSVIATTKYPSHTTITSAIDGNNNPILNSGSTPSTSITFTVQATAGTNPLAGFQCSLDNGPFSSCSTASNNAGTITYNNLAAGQHIFKVQAVDNQGNVDPIPATFSWTILTSGQCTLTPGQCIQKIIDTINGMNLPNGPTTSLESTLYDALKQLNDNHHIIIICNNLSAFINKVNADQTSGQLTSQQAADLIQQAVNVQKAIGCSTSSSVPASSSTNINNSIKPFNDPTNGLTAGSE